MQRQDDLRNMEAQHRREIDGIRASYEDKLRLAESARLDAIRATSDAAVTRAAEVAAAQATALAAQVTTSAETLRSQVAAAATAAATALATALLPITTSIDSLRAAQYQQQGQQTQKTEGRDTSQWLITTIIAAVAIAFTWFLAHK